jgi:hypothetical protein
MIHGARPPGETPPYGGPERRRRRRGAISRLLTAPLALERVESRFAALSAATARVWPLVAALVVLAAGWWAWAARTPVITPRHRPEALWFALAASDFHPPMTIEPGVAMVRGRFNDRTPAAVAVREAMHFTDDMVIEERLLHIGDYDVSELWLHIPAGNGHWLVLAWMEESDLALVSFRFASDDTDLSPDEVRWGNRLMRRILVPEYFRAAEVPAIRLRAPGGAPPPTFGPKPQG